ncbi:MAG TPA: single-stranded-DNA-specific exonuclease RecJ [Candidatus Limnocylindrales bacterium]
MAETRFRWVFPTPIALDPAFIAAGERLGLPARVTQLLGARGLSQVADLEAFLADPESCLHDPARLPDAAVFAARIELARARTERVMVFGDFDADGLTGLAILVLALRRLGIAVEPYVPSRLDEGHGLSVAAVDKAVASGITVIVTVDCGTTSVDEVARAVAAGIDVLVTDHHRVPPALPAAVAIINPHRADATYPDRRLAGSGVAFKLAQLLLRDEPGGAAAALDLTDLAAIGSVADVVPILGENRAIARLGLERLRRAPRPGIAALLARAGIDPATADLETIAFGIAPRLNAAGRVGDALDAARLLLADDPAEAAGLAESLEVTNRTRRDMTKVAVEEARAAVAAAIAATDAVAVATAAAADSEPGVTIVRGDWPVGIVGLVASRLVEDLGRPAIVGANLGATVRASCRSDGSLDLGAALESCRDLFTRHGGHAGAAGFEVPVELWDAFRTRFELLAAVERSADRRPVIAVDLAVPAAEIGYPLQRDLARLAPCGPGNPEPVVAILGLTVTRLRAATGGHAQLTLRRVRDVLDGIAFDRADLLETVRNGDVVDVVGRVVSRRFGGLETLQIEIRDVAPSGSLPGAAAVLRAAGVGTSLVTAGEPA